MTRPPSTLPFRRRYGRRCEPPLAGRRAGVPDCRDHVGHVNSPRDPRRRLSIIALYSARASSYSAALGSR